jgi:hypothetical protein
VRALPWGEHKRPEVAAWLDAPYDVVVAVECAYNVAIHVRPQTLVA